MCSGRQQDGSGLRSSVGGREGRRPVAEGIDVRCDQWLNGKESVCNAGDAWDAALIPGLGRSPGGGHGNPLQYSCLEYPMDRGAWWATVHGVTKSQTWLMQLSTHGLVSYQGNQQRGMTRTTALIRRVTSWAWGKSIGRSVVWMGVGEAGTGWAGHVQRPMSPALESLFSPFLPPELQRGADVLPGMVVLQCPSPAWSPVPPH